LDVKNLELEAISFNQAPTKSQLTNALHDISKFLGRVGGALILDGAYSVADPPLGQMLNASIQIKAAADAFDAGPNSSGLSLPQPVPGQGPQRVR
jgi:hypothetical protein